VAEHNSEVDQFERKFREAEPEAVAQWTIYEVFAADQAGGVGMVTFYGHVSTKDRATGQPVRPCLISVSAPLELFATFVLPDLDPEVAAQQSR
jgi:restriction system protein